MLYCAWLRLHDAYAVRALAHTRDTNQFNFLVTTRLQASWCSLDMNSHRSILPGNLKVLLFDELND